MSTRGQAIASPSMIAQGYEDQRRLNAASFIGTALSGVLFFLLVGLIIFAAASSFAIKSFVEVWLTITMLCGAEALYIYGTRAASKHQLDLATGTIIASTYVALLAIEVGWIFVLGKGLDPIGLVLLASNGFALVVTGLLGKSTIVLQMTLVLNILTLTLLTIALQPNGVHSSGSFQAALTGEEALLITLILLEQYAIAAIMVGINLLLDQLFGELGTAYSQVQRLDSLKDQFITHVNHELRTPLMAVQGFVELARRRQGRVPAEDLAYLIERAGTASSQVISFVNSVLSVSQLEQTAAPVWQSVDAREVILSSLDLIDPREGQIVGRDIKLSVPPGLTIWGDLQKIRQIMSNFISNALKYSNVDSAIEVTVQHAAPDGGGKVLHAFAIPDVEIRVKDYGLGIPTDQSALLFNRFVRLPRDLASKVVGNGLGLYLCKQFAESMGGKVWVESSGIPGEGSSFYLRLPGAE